MALLEVREVDVRFGGLDALRHVDLQVNDCEVVGLLGPNGAGKTTLFNAISGFQAPDRGRVFLLGVDVTRLGPHERVRLGLGRTFQLGGLVPSFTVMDNLLAAQHLHGGYSLGAAMLGLPGARRSEAEMRRRAERVLAFMGLQELAGERLDGLSYGTLRTCEVAAAVAVDPVILALDEPFAGMSPEESGVFADKLLRMRDELGVAILIVDHHVPQVLRIADIVYVLNFGQMLASGTPEEIRRSDEVREAYMGREGDHAA